MIVSPQAEVDIQAIQARFSAGAVQKGQAVRGRAEKLALRAMGRIPAPVAAALARKLFADGDPARWKSLLGPDPSRLDPTTGLLLATGERLYRPMWTLPVPEARRQATHLALEVAPNPRGDIHCRDTHIAADPSAIAVRIFTPREVPAAPPPVCVFFHGGGGVIGDIAGHDPFCRELAGGLGAMVVSVAYRLAPEHPFPAGLDDACAAYRWVAANAAALGGDPARLALCGGSAGATLATTVARRARDQGWPRPVLQLLFCPLTDLSPRFPSRETFADGFFLTRSLLDWFTDFYAPDPATRADPWASPLRAEDLGDLAPAVVVTAGFDPLRDEGRAYAHRLERAGNQVRYVCAQELVHSFELMTGVVPAARRSLDRILAIAKAGLT